MMKKRESQRRNELQIAEIQIIPVKPHSGLVAFASCIINSSLYIGNIAIYTSPSTESGFRLVYPLKILPNGKEIQCVHPINKEAGDLIATAVIQKLREIMKKAAK